VSSDESIGPSEAVPQTPTGTFLGFSTTIVNGAEVLYNEGRGEPKKGRDAVAWGIRNRATIKVSGIRA